LSQKRQKIEHENLDSVSKTQEYRVKGELEKFGISFKIEARKKILPQA